MICKSEGIILQVTDFQENAVIAQIYSKDFGKKGFLIPHARSTRSRISAIVQELSSVEFVFYHRPNRSLQKITEIQSLMQWTQMFSNLEKLSSAMALLEVFKLSVQEEETPDLELYYWLKSAFIHLDQSCGTGFSIFIKKWMELQVLLGISADNESIEGQISQEPTGIYSHERDRWMTLLSQTHEIEKIEIPISVRKSMINYLIQHYQYHFNQSLHLKSLSSLAEMGFIGQD